MAWPSVFVSLFRSDAMFYGLVMSSNAALDSFIVVSFLGLDSFAPKRPFRPPSFP